MKSSHCTLYGEPPNPTLRGNQNNVRLQRLSDYPVFLSIIKHGDCLSEYMVRLENVAWSIEMLEY